MDVKMENVKDRSLLCIWGFHDSSATFVDKNDNLRVFELERVTKNRYSMFSSIFDSPLNGEAHSSEEVRENFLSLIKQEIKSEPKTILYYSIPRETNKEFLEDVKVIKKYFPNARVKEFNIHHGAHASCGYYQSPFKDALIFSIDGGGYDFNDHATTRVYEAKSNSIKEICKHSYDFGRKYAELGYSVSEINFGKNNIEIDVYLSYSGKLMGLCAYGNVIPEWVEPMKRYYKDNSFNNLQLGNQLGFYLGTDNISGQTSYDLCATSQYVFEETLMEFIMSFYEKNKTNIVLTGGCALNVLFNQKLKQVLNSDGYDLYVPPNPNDCGLSLGQYLFVTKEHIQPLVYSGVDILDRDKIESYLEKNEYHVEEISVQKIVDLISQQKIGGIIQGYSEVGPRALGNRSIICDPSFSDMKDVINAKVKFREWYRPFAPVCREEDKDIYFDDAFSSEYMSLAPSVKEEYRKLLPSITHADGTARLQTVTENTNKLFYDILSLMSKQDKVPVILNTSFNIKGKSILTTYEDAFYVLENTALDFIVLENILVIK